MLPSLPSSQRACQRVGRRDQAHQNEVLISVNAHSSKIVAVVGHHNCAAHPASEAQHKQDIVEAMATVRSWNLPVQVVGLWVNSEWRVEVVCSAA